MPDAYEDEPSVGESVNPVHSSLSALGKRLKKAIERIGKDAAAESTGKSGKSLDRYVSGEVEPPVSVITRLAERSGLSVQWLATGEGPEMLAEAGDRASDSIAVARLDVRASAGSGASGDAGDTVEMIGFPRAWLRGFGVAPANARVLTVSGDSMEPTLSSGDLLLVDTSVERIKGAALYVLVIDDDVFVKRAQPRLNGSILITSDNERYPPEEVSADAARSLRIAGRVVWFGRSI